ncbi:MAG: LVIVD repeat-containing protein [Promethearchaeota archaeon]
MLQRNRIVLVIILFQVFLLVPNSLVSANTTNYLYELTELAQLATNGLAYDLESVGDLVYITDMNENNPEGLVIVDVSNPADPLKLGSYYDGEGRPLDVYIKDHLAFVADEFDGLEIINVTDPQNPQKIGEYTDGGDYHDDLYAAEVEIKDSCAFVADVHGGFHIVNITDPTNPRKINFVSTGEGCDGIKIAENFAYVVSTASGLIIFDISNINNVVQMGSYTPSPGFIFPYIYNDLAIVSNHLSNTGEIRILNVSNPSNIRELSQFKGEGIAQRVQVVNQTLYMADGLFGIKLLNISDPTNPFIIGKYGDGSGLAHDVAVKGNIAFVADSRDGLEILEISKNENYQILTSSTPTSTIPTSEVLAPGFLFTIFGLLSLEIMYLVKRKKHSMKLNTYEN